MRPRRPPRRSWLMGRTKPGAAEALREHRAAADPLVAEHGGRIVTEHHRASFARNRACAARNSITLRRASAAAVASYPSLMPRIVRSGSRMSKVCGAPG